MATRISTSLAVLLAAQAIQAATTLLAAPVLLAGLGLDGYGLLGIAATLTLLLGILDAGLAAALTRRFAAEGAAAGAALLAAAERLLLAGGCVLVLAAAGLAWPLSGLLSSPLPRGTLATALALAALAGAALWPTTLYQAGLNGRGRQAEAALIHAGGTVLRWGGSVVLVLGPLPDVRAVLLWQAIAALASVALLRLRLRRGLPPARASVSGAGAYARDVSVLALAGLLFAVLDRLAGATLLSLAAFGAYSLIAQIAQMLGVLIVPARAVWFPRLSAALATQDAAEARRALGDAVQVAAILVVPWAAVLALLPGTVLWAWTGSGDLVRRAAVGLTGLATGWGLHALASAAAIFDLARGSMRRATRLSAAGAVALALLAPAGALLGGTAGLGVAAGVAIGVYAAVYAAAPAGPLGTSTHPGLLAALLRTGGAAAAPALIAALAPAASGRIGAGIIVWLVWLGGSAAAALVSPTGRMALAVAADRLRRRG
jgi:O-antigen/teichoic acid export membrane protein